MTEMLKKAKERDDIIKRRTMEIKRHASLQREQFLKFKERVADNIFNDKQKRWKSFMERKKVNVIKEEKERERKFTKLAEISEKAELRNVKIQQAMQESKKLLEMKKQNILQRQFEDNQRLEMQRQKKMEDEKYKKELGNIRNEIKMINATRKKRKDTYHINRVKDKLEFDEMRRLSFSQQNEDFRRLRLSDHFQSLSRREVIR